MTPQPCEHGSSTPHVDSDFLSGETINCPGPKDYRASIEARPGLDEALASVKGANDGMAWIIHQSVDAAYPIIAAAVRADERAKVVAAVEVKLQQAEQDVLDGHTDTSAEAAHRVVDAGAALICVGTVRAALNEPSTP